MVTDPKYIIKQNEAQLQAILNAAVDGIVTINSTGYILSVNASAARIFGYTQEELVGQHVSILMPEPYRSNHQSYIDNFISTKVGHVIGVGGREIPGLRKDGSIVPLELAVSHVQLEDTSLFTAILRDISTRKKDQENLLNAYQLLADKDAHISEDLDAAAMIQKLFLPHPLPEVDGWDIAWRFHPTACLAGDIFNIFELDTDVIGIYMLDICGHGVPAAMVSIAVYQTLHPHMGVTCRKDVNGHTQLTNPSEVIAALEKEFPMERFKKYFTISYLLLNKKTGEITYSNAGHPPILLAHNDGTIERLCEGSTPVGMGSFLPPSEGTACIQPGESLLLYTDGYIDITDPQGEFFGEERLEAVFNESAKLSADKCLTHLDETLRIFTQAIPPCDDISLLCLKRNAECD